MSRIGDTSPGKAFMDGLHKLQGKLPKKETVKEKITNIGGKAVEKAGKAKTYVSKKLPGRVKVLEKLKGHHPLDYTKKKVKKASDFLKTKKMSIGDDPKDRIKMQMNALKKRAGDVLKAAGEKLSPSQENENTTTSENITSQPSKKPGRPTRALPPTPNRPTEELPADRPSTPPKKKNNNDQN